MRSDLLNKKFLILSTKNNENIMFKNQHTTKKSNYKVDILVAMNQMDIFRNFNILNNCCDFY